MGYIYNEHSQQVEQAGTSATNFSTDVQFTAGDNVTLNWTSGQVITGGGFKSVNSGTATISGTTYVYFDGTDTLKLTTDIGQLTGHILMATVRDTVAGTNLIISTEANAGNSVLIGTDNIEPLAVTTSKIADNAVIESKLGDDSVTTIKIKDLNVTTSKLADDSVTTIKIKDANVTKAKLSFTTVEVTNVAGKDGFDLMGVRLESDGTDLFWGGVQIN